MRIARYILLASTLFFSCNDEKSAPDVSGIAISLQVQRLDNDFFSIDTSNLERDLGALQAKYPDFLTHYLQQIVGVETPDAIRGFYRNYHAAYDSTQKIYKDVTPLKDGLEQAFRYVKHYFPQYEVPKRFITVVGGMDSRFDLSQLPSGEYTPNFIGPGLVGVSLQFYLGSEFSFYKTTEFINTLAPLYRSRRFSREYIVPDVMKLVTDDIYADKSNRLPLLERMVEKGKQWWLLDKFLPELPDSVKTGYTQRQLDFCEENEGMIWSYIVANEKLDALDPAIIQTYIGEAPFTQSIAPEVSPGNIGQWIGWQIIRRYEEKNKDKKVSEILKATPREILEEAKYKPK